MIHLTYEDELCYLTLGTCYGNGALYHYGGLWGWIGGDGQGTGLCKRNSVFNMRGEGYGVDTALAMWGEQDVMLGNGKLRDE
jgi:hypothetical protein